MQKIQVAKPFLLTHDDGTEQRFAAGVHEVEDGVAGHWYVKLHLVPEAAAEEAAEGAEQTAAGGASRRKAAASQDAAQKPAEGAEQTAAK